MKDKTDSKAFNVIVKGLYGGVTRMAHYKYVMNDSDYGFLYLLGSSSVPS